MSARSQENPASDQRRACLSKNWFDAQTDENSSQHCFRRNGCTRCSESSKERVEKHANDDSSTSENLAEPTLSSSTATTRDELVATLNCSYIRDFATAAPAIGGFTCASDGRKSHPMTIFQYVNSGGIAAKNARIKSAVQKACDHNREEVFVLSSPEIFVYTLSSIAVDSSPLADSFRSIKTGLCS